LRSLTHSGAASDFERQGGRIDIMVRAVIQRDFKIDDREAD
jgi:hypothetical protein